MKYNIWYEGEIVASFRFEADRVLFLEMLYEISPTNTYLINKGK